MEAKGNDIELLAAWSRQERRVEMRIRGKGGYRRGCTAVICGVCAPLMTKHGCWRRGSWWRCVARVRLSRRSGLVARASEGGGVGHRCAADGAAWRLAATQNPRHSAIGIGMRMGGLGRDQTPLLHWGLSVESLRAKVGAQLMVVPVGRSG